MEGNSLSMENSCLSKKIPANELSSDNEASKDEDISASITLEEGIANRTEGTQEQDAQVTSDDKQTFKPPAQVNNPKYASETKTPASKGSNSVDNSIEKKFKCDSCPKTFSSKNGLNSHTIIHSGDKPFKCEQCSYAGNQKGNLRSHIKRMHVK